ncbi:precorrin-3B C(17)-methyltransferase [Halorubrum halophilum]|uniref:precorrin-3B C(17)-methyltransferase n=1 Tax=Halorubrum halophilum TaxID=413816 RepID=UPI0006784267|nr:SAM-dependent methyltransferase [Halorubrum halophilum]
MSGEAGDGTTSGRAPLPDSRAAAGGDPDGEAPEGYGTLYVVGIGPGLPDELTERARRVVKEADCVIASNLYQAFLRENGTLPPEADQEAADQELVRSSMGKQVELAREAFERVRDGQDVAHVSGGDPNVYGKSDLLFTMAEAEEATDVPIEIVPGVTAGLSLAATLGAPLSNDFCTISLSDKWRGWEEIEEKLHAAAAADFVIVLYNCWRDYERAIDAIREARHDDVPVAIVNDAGRGDAGRNVDGETYTLTTLGEATEHDEEVGGMGTSILVGTHETEVWRNDYRPYLVTPRGGRDVEDF